MTEYPYSAPSRRRPRRRRSTLLRAAVALVVLAGTFALGVALGEALHDGPRDRGTVTYVRTLRPLPQQPAATP